MCNRIQTNRDKKYGQSTPDGRNHRKNFKRNDTNKVRKENCEIVKNRYT